MAQVRVTGRVKKIEQKSGTLDNGDPWANQAVTVICNDEAVVVKFQKDLTLDFKVGDYIDVFADAFNPKLKFDMYIGGEAAEELAGLVGIG